MSDELTFALWVVGYVAGFAVTVGVLLALIPERDQSGGIFFIALIWPFSLATAAAIGPPMLVGWLAYKVATALKNWSNA